MQPKHETKNCPRCNSNFECKSGSILLCQRQTILLSEEQMNYISSLYDDCLCINCLRALRAEYNQLGCEVNHEEKCAVIRIDN